MSVKRIQREIAAAERRLAEAQARFDTNRVVGAEIDLDTLRAELAWVQRGAKKAA